MVFVSNPANAAVYSAAAAASAANVVAQLVGKALRHNYVLHKSYTNVLLPPMSMQGQNPGRMTVTVLLRHT